MLSVEHKSALLISSIVCVASGGIFVLDWGFSTHFQRVPATNFSPNGANIKGTGIFKCLLCTSFHKNASKGSRLEAPLCVIVSVWNSPSKICKFTISHRFILSVLKCDYAVVLSQCHSRTVQFGCIILHIIDCCWSWFSTFPVWQTRRTRSLSCLGYTDDSH